MVQCRSPKHVPCHETVKKGRVTKAKGVPKMQDALDDEGVASFWQPWRLKESICARPTGIPN